jgi:hypothetical protein
VRFAQSTRIVVAGQTVVRGWFWQQVFLTGSVRVVTSLASVVGERLVDIRPFDPGSIVAGETRLVFLSRQHIGVARAVS